ncbi:hypothetical protein B0H63DRAFT_67926 [Podospora didyma]|uniref:Uncharacterized protein n=1 Tax=Podospora didyma TaxID=330526 RepID=A0AAE0K131_9PEZI|nr:hypothetical protein B0H63DRAFT_67926 [Podospora didyma]
MPVQPAAIVQGAGSTMSPMIRSQSTPLPVRAQAPAQTPAPATPPRPVSRTTPKKATGQKYRQTTLSLSPSELSLSADPSAEIAPSKRNAGQGSRQTPNKATEQGLRQTTISRLPSELSLSLEPPVETPALRQRQTPKKATQEDLQQRMVPSFLDSASNSGGQATPRQTPRPSSMPDPRPVSTSGLNSGNMTPRPQLAPQPAPCMPSSQGNVQLGSPVNSIMGFHGGVEAALQSQVGPSDAPRSFSVPRSGPSPLGAMAPPPKPSIQEASPSLSTCGAPVGIRKSTPQASTRQARHPALVASSSPCIGLPPGYTSKIRGLASSSALPELLAQAQQKRAASGSSWSPGVSGGNNHHVLHSQIPFLGFNPSLGQMGSPAPPVVDSAPVLAEPKPTNTPRPMTQVTGGQDLANTTPQPGQEAVPNELQNLLRYRASSSQKLLAQQAMLNMSRPEFMQYPNSDAMQPQRQGPLSQMSQIAAAMGHPLRHALANFGDLVSTQTRSASANGAGSVPTQTGSASANGVGLVSAQPLPQHQQNRNTSANVAGLVSAHAPYSYPNSRTVANGAGLTPTQSPRSHASSILQGSVLSQSSRQRPFQQNSANVVNLVSAEAPRHRPIQQNSTDVVDLVSADSPRRQNSVNAVGSIPMQSPCRRPVEHISANVAGLVPRQQNHQTLSNVAGLVSMQSPRHPLAVNATGLATLSPPSHSTSVSPQPFSQHQTNYQTSSNFAGLVSMRPPCQPTLLLTQPCTQHQTNYQTSSNVSSSVSSQPPSHLALVSPRPLPPQQPNDQTSTNVAGYVPSQLFPQSPAPTSQMTVEMQWH